MPDNRLKELFDCGVFTAVDSCMPAVPAGFGEVGGVGVYAFLLDTALTRAVCEKIIKLYTLAQKTGCPIVGIYDSGGVKLDEGFETISACGELLKASARISGVVPQISLIDGACLGTAALTANAADIVIVTQDSELSPAPPSEISIAELAEAGCADIVTASFEEAAEQVRALLAMLPANNLTPVPVSDYTEPDGTAQSIVERLSDSGSVVALKQAYAAPCTTALAAVKGMTVGFADVGGETLTPQALYKLEALVRLCDAYHIPLVTVADTAGFAKQQDAQLLTAATKLVSAYASATCVKISLITAKSIGTGYITLAGKGVNADYVLAFEDAVVSALDTPAAVAFLWGDRLAAGEDRAALEAEYERTLAAVGTVAASGAADAVIPSDGAREQLAAVLAMLAGKRETTLPRKHSVK